MRILVIYRHFWPDTPPYASMLRSIATDLAKAGHDISILTEMPSYKVSTANNNLPKHEEIEGVRIHRLNWLPFWSQSKFIRTLDKAFFPFRVLLSVLNRRLRGERYDLVWTATMPPVINGLSGYIASKITGARFIYHFQDIYPELGAVSGIWRQNKILYNTLMALDMWTCRKMDKAIVLSEDMAQSLQNRGIPKERMTIINNFMLDNFDTAPQNVDMKDSEPGIFDVIFAGNLGRFQGLENVAEAARLLADRTDIRFTFMGEGSALSGLHTQTSDLTNVRFIAHLPFEKAKSIIASANLGIVSLQPEIYRYAYPSKTLSYLGLGLPILAIIETNSALARMIEEEKLGVIANRTGPAIAGAILRAKSSFDDDTRNRTIEFYEQTFATNVALRKWRNLIAGETST